MIRNPNDIQEGAKKIRMLIAGYPGIGKSTLALSAPNPLHIDVDFGIDRIEPRYRKPYIQPQSYDEILSDLTPINLQDFDTLVFDTGGKLISLMSLWAIKKDPKYGQRDGSLSLKGYGFVGKEFVRLMDYCFYELQKNIVIVFHATEEKDGDNTRLRIKVEGQTKNNVWEPMDLGGFVEIYGNDRTIGFSNCERYFAKGTRGISGIRKIPALGPTSPNDFLTKLFAEYNAKATAEVEQNAVDQAAYEAAMVEGTAIIAGIVDADTANAAMPKYQAIKHALTSNKELADRTFNCFFRGGIDFRYARRRGISSHDYTLLMAAKSLYCHTAEVTQGDLAEPQIIPDEAFRLLINALLIARFGLDALKITERRGQRGYTLRRLIRREAGGNAPSAGLLFPSEGR